VRSRSLALLACLTVVLAACGGDGESDADDVLLDETSFAQVVAAELRSEELEATAEGQGLDVRVEDGLDWIALAPREQFEEYRRDPERRGEIVAAVVQEAQRRLEQGIGELSFSEAKDSLMPLLKPRFALRTLDETPAQTGFPADLAVVYAVDRERDFTVVTPADVQRWGRSLGEIHQLALANLSRQTNGQDWLLCEPVGGEKLCGWASEDGYDATRIIVPELRRQIEKEYGGPAVYAMPMEHVSIALSFQVATRENTEQALRLKVRQDFSMADNPVSPELFVERNGKLVVFEA
jgi:uncharacterized protein YtpQ (UPF0354 family)